MDPGVGGGAEGAAGGGVEKRQAGGRELEAGEVPGSRGLGGGSAGLYRAERGGEGHDLGGAQVFDSLDAAAQGGGVGQRDVFGADAEDKRPARRFLKLGQGNTMVAKGDVVGSGLGGAFEPQEVHCGAADEVGDKQGRRVVVDVLRGAELFDDAVVHHDDLVAHLHRLKLVMGDVDSGRVHAVVENAQFLGHDLAEFGVERAEGFVHHEGLGVAHDGTAEGHALAVAS